MRDRGLVLFLTLALLGLGVAGALLGAGAGGSRASDDRGPEGTAALAAVLRQMGHEVEAMRVGLNALMREPTGSVLFVVSAPGLVPSAVVGDGEIRRLERFVEEGSTVVVVTHYADTFLDELGPAFEYDAIDTLDHDAGEESKTALPLLPGPLTLGGPLAITGRGALHLGGLHDEPLFAVGPHPVAIRRGLGDGFVVAISDPTTVTNRGLGRGGNLEFYTALVESHLGEGGKVLFDDLHAGGGDDFGVIAYARRSGLTPALLAVLLLGAGYLWRAGSRFGAVLPPPDRRNPRPSSELVGAIGDLYERAGLHGHVVALMSRRFRRKVEQRSGMAWKREDLEAWVQSELGPDASRLFAQIRHGFGALLNRPEPDPEDVLTLARRVHRFETTWLTHRRTRSEDPPT